MIPKEITKTDIYNNLLWEEIDEKELDNVIEGMQIIGSEPVDYPLTDEITLYIKDKINNIYALSIGYDDLSAEKQKTLFVQIAKVNT